MVGAANNAFVAARPPAAGKASTTLLASLLVLALILCHGALGGFHQLAPSFGTAAPHGQTHAHADHVPSGPETAPGGERPSEHGQGHTAPYLPPSEIYLAALLVVFLASVFGPVSRGASPLTTVGSWAVRRPPPDAFLPGRTPAAPSLQVFRL